MTLLRDNHLVGTLHQPRLEWTPSTLVDTVKPDKVTMSCVVTRCRGYYQYWSPYQSKLSESSESNGKIEDGLCRDVELNVVLQILDTDLASFEQVVASENTSCRIIKEEIEANEADTVDPNLTNLYGSTCTISLKLYDMGKLSSY